MSQKPCENCGKFVPQRFVSKYTENRWLCADCRDGETQTTLIKKAATTSIPSSQPPKKKLSSGKIFFIFLGCIVVIGIIGNFVRTRKTGSVVNQGAGQQVQPVENKIELTDKVKSVNWVYENTTNAMGYINRTAAVVSTNTVTFGSPYDVVQNATLTIRNHSSMGRDIYVTLEKAQLHFEYDNKYVIARFDEAKPITVSVLEPADNSSNMFFIANYNSFIKKITGAKKLFVQAQFYQEGYRVFEFDVSNLNMDRLK